MSAICSCLLLVFACGDDDEGEKAGGSTMTPGGGASGNLGIDLTGSWVSTDFECRSSKKRETLQVDQRDLNVSGTKITGDDCVPAGYVSFEGKLPRARILASELPVSFPVKLYGGDPGSPETIGVSDSGMAKITTPDSISLQLSRSTIVLTRVFEDAAAGSGGTGGAGGTMAAGGKGGSGSGVIGKPTTNTQAGTGGSGGADEPDDQAGAGGGGSGGKPAGRASAVPSTGGRSGSGGSGGSGGRGGAGAGGMSDEAGSGGAGGMSDAAGSGGKGGATAAANCKGPLLPGATCDHVQQCGCKLDETCQFAGAEPPRCQAAGPKTTGEVCEVNADCGAGLLCVNRVCRHNCRTDSDCSGTCNDATYDDKEVEGLKFCLDPCDPVLPRDCTSPLTGCAPCAKGATCLPALPMDNDFAYCAAPDLVLNRAAGERCTKDEECFGGGCEEGTCHRWCQTDRDCDSDETCESGSGRYIKSGVEAGYCTTK
ncbi:MAG TPA: hypothetical protein VJV78_18945 [Polyangiales bacterium]|nr:hypothetical protein [Polyangiales bacterium]